MSANSKDGFPPGKHAKDIADVAGHTWRGTLDSVSDAVFLLNVDQRIVNMNAAALRMVGKSADEVEGRHCWEIVHGSSCPPGDCPHRKMLISGQRETLILEEGDRVMRFSVEPLPGPGGMVSGSVHIASDITEIQRAERKIRQSEEMLTIMLDHAPFAIMVVGRDKTIRHVNQAVLEMTGYTSPDELLGRHCQEVFCRGDECPAFDLGADVDRSERSLVNKQGECIPILKSIASATLAGEEVLLESFVDISDLRKAEQKIADLARFPSENPNPVLRIGKDGQVLYSNDAGHFLLAAWDCSHSKPLPPSWIERVNNVLEQATPKQVEADCGGRTFSVTLAPVTEFGYVNIYAHDIARQKKIEREMREANARLAHAVEELQKKDKQLIQQERLSALGQMASGIAHDFNNALMPIVGLSELLVTSPDLLDDRTEALAFLAEINTAASDAAAIVHRLRSFYRSADKGSFEPVDMNELVADVITLTKSKWKEEMGAKGIDVKVHAELQRIKPAYGNRTELREIFTNLVLNAVDSLDEDGSITISTATRDGMVVLTVADTGSGMSRETKEHCFEPFYSTKGDEGTGLGLSMVHGIVKRHSGTIDVQSERGRGTTFSISLPMATGETLKRRKPTTPAAAVSPKRILAVDDDVRSRRLLKRILAAEQHSIETASSGREALARVRNADFDLVITDRSMPDMRGDEVAKEVKTLCPEMPVILLTGFGEAMRDKREMPDGVDRVISKPVTQEDMRTVIAEIFAEKPFEQPGVCA